MSINTKSAVLDIKIVNVTPSIAAELLKKNTANRSIRRKDVDDFKAVFARGEFRTTHQGVAFSKSGVMLDGQHRLTAIAELRAGVFPMQVTLGMEEDSYGYIDKGRKRTSADQLRMADNRLVECARLIVMLCTGDRSNLTADVLKPVVEAIQPAHDSLLAFCPRKAKTWGSAPARLAALISMGTGDAVYAKQMYAALVYLDFDRMPPIVQALYRAHAAGAVKAADSADMLARCLKAFNPACASMKKLQINSTTDAVDRVRAVYGHLIEEATV